MSLISCSFADNVEWNNSFSKIELPENEAHVWRVNHIIFNNELAYLKSALSEEELNKANRFLKAVHQSNYIISHAALRIILAKYIDEKAVAIQFTENENKKPQLLVNNNSVQFNLSHSHEYSLIAIAQTEAGVDIEYINKKFSHNEILQTFFAEDEIEFIQSSSNSLQDFYTCWTRKEALLKGTSHGLKNNIANIPCLNGENIIEDGITKTNWLVQTFDVDENYIGSIALHSSTSSIKFFDFKL